jgi:ubiquinone/menaquinone biosynthesis C-methylase UbiE
MIDFENSLENKTKLLRNFIEREFKFALDLGCGSGVDSIALSKLGLLVDACDHSSEMLKSAIQNAKKNNVNINFIQANLSNFPIEDKKYDLIVSLGNTIANIDKTDLDKFIQKTQDLLNVDGKVIIQIINYSSLPKSGEYILKKYDDEQISILRKYDIYNSYIDFIIEKADKKSGEKSRIVTKLFPHNQKSFIELAQRYNLNIKIFGNLKKEQYIENKSANLVLEMRKKP